MGEDETQSKVRVQRDRCPYCHDSVDPVQEKLSCDACMAWHHAGCWTEHGACSACGAERYSGSRLQELPKTPGGRKACAWDGCDQPVTSYEGDYAVTVGTGRVVSMVEVCTPHALDQLRIFAQQTLILGLSMGALGVAVTVLIVLKGSGTPGWQAQFVLTALFLLGSLAGFTGRRKYLREIRELEGKAAGNEPPEA